MTKKELLKTLHKLYIQGYEGESKLPPGHQPYFDDDDIYLKRKID